MGKDKSGKLRRIDRKQTRHDNRTSNRNSFLGCPIVLAAIVAVMMLGVRIGKTPPDGQKRGCWAKGSRR